MQTVKGAPAPEPGDGRFGQPYGDDAAYIAALAAAYKDFAQTILAEREGKPRESRFVGVDPALRVATFNTIAARSIVPGADDSTAKWLDFTVPKVELLV